MKEKILKTALVVFVLLSAIFLINYLLYSDEDRIRGLIRQGKRAIEEEDLDRCMNGIALNYHSEEFGLNYLVVQRLLKEAFKAFEDIRIKIKGVQIEVKDGESEVYLRVTATARPTEGTGREGFYEEPLVLSLRKSGTRWKLVGARREG